VAFLFDDEAFEGEPSLSPDTDVALVKAQNLLSSAKNLRSSTKTCPGRPLNNRKPRRRRSSSAIDRKISLSRGVAAVGLTRQK
jgi:hypothetical protein